MTEETKNRIRKMVTDRNWKQFHTPSNLAKSISIEVLLKDLFDYDSDGKVQ